MVLCNHILPCVCPLFWCFYCTATCNILLSCNFFCSVECLPALYPLPFVWVNSEFWYLARFSPEALSWLFFKGLVGWFLQVSLLKMTLLSLDSGEAPLLDIVPYVGYAFAGLSIALLGTIIWNYSYYFLMPWTSLFMGSFLVKTMKRVLFAQVRTYDLSRHHYLLLFIGRTIWKLKTLYMNWLATYSTEMCTITLVMFRDVSLVNRKCRRRIERRFFW